MNNYLFNFSVSYSGGGYKRLYEYSKWFNKNGGAIFIIHPNNSNLLGEFENNKYITVNQNLFQRVFNDCAYLNYIIKEIGKPKFYYSYGIPMNMKIANINWFHLSNILPIIPFKIPMSFYNRLKFIYLGYKLKNGFKNSDIISAESNYSLSLINSKLDSKLFLSVNGSDDELSNLSDKTIAIKDNIVLIIGTQWYKTIDDSYSIFLHLRSKEPSLKMIIIGSDKYISNYVKKDDSVLIINKFLERKDLICYLRKCKYYISTTLIENSYNAISEGIFFANESYVSDIGPHQELLNNMVFEKISFPKMKRSFLHINRNNIDGLNLKSWDYIILDMLNKIKNYKS